MKGSILCFMMAAMLPLAFAAAKEDVTETNADSRAKLQQVADEVRGEMHAGGRFEFVKPAERKTIDAKFAEMDALFAQSGSVEGMKVDAKIQLFDAQETINSILTQRDGDRVICKREPIPGSHIRTESCHTYRDEIAKAEISRKAMKDFQTQKCTGGIACPIETANGTSVAPAAGTARTH
ncbi:MAG TPA: hypothetical protein VGC55_11405 [Dokdonella sp.]